MDNSSLKRARLGRPLLITIVICAIAAWSGPSMKRWATEPTLRQGVLLELPIDLKQGATVTGSFKPQRWGSYVVCLDLWGSTRPGLIDPLLSRDPLDGGERRPPAVRLAYSIQDEGRWLAGGEATELERQWHAGDPERVSLAFARVEHGKPLSQALSVQVLEANTELDAIDSAFTVRPEGDWIMYAWWDALMRDGTCVLCLLGAARLLAVTWLRWYRGRASG